MKAFAFTSQLPIASCTDVLQNVEVELFERTTLATRTVMRGLPLNQIVLKAKAKVKRLSNNSSYNNDVDKQQIGMFNEHFSINNIPFGIASSGMHVQPSVATRFESRVLFLDDLMDRGYLKGLSNDTKKAFAESTLNAFAALGKSKHRKTRTAIRNLIISGGDQKADCLAVLDKLPRSASCSIENATLHLPLSIGDFTDFACCEYHLINAGKVISDGQCEVPAEFYHFPIGYPARTSSIVVSGTPIRRPKGLYIDSEGKVTFAPTQKLDYGLQIAAVIGKSTKLGDSVTLEDAEDYIFGLVLLNDWSARDIQARLLGPLTWKSFGTTISPWVITPEALKHSQVEVPARSSNNPQLLGYLTPQPRALQRYTFDIKLSASFIGHDSPKQTLADGSIIRDLTTLCTTDFKSLYWNLNEIVVQQTVTGCNLNVGDLLSTGTISGKEDPLSHGPNHRISAKDDDSRGCLLELKDGFRYSTDNDDVSPTRKKQKKWLEDGDTIILNAYAGEGVGFGSCLGTILPANE